MWEVVVSLKAVLGFTKTWVNFPYQTLLQNPKQNSCEASENPSVWFFSTLVAQLELWPQMLCGQSWTSVWAKAFISPGFSVYYLWQWFMSPFPFMRKNETIVDEFLFMNNTGVTFLPRCGVQQRPPGWISSSGGCVLFLYQLLQSCNILSITNAIYLKNK